MIKLVKYHVDIVIAFFIFFLVFINQWLVDYKHFYISHILFVLSIALSFYLLGHLLSWLFNLKIVNQKKRSVEYASTYVSIWLGYFIFVCGIVVYFQVDLPLTPYPLIDPQLHYLDALIGFHELAVVRYTNQHLSILLPGLTWIYNQLNNEVVLTLIFLPMVSWEKFRQVFRLFFILVGMTIIFYYFFPNIGPAFEHDAYPYSHTLLNQLSDYCQLRNNHQLQPVYGIISCPSWHVICALLLIYGWWNIKRFGIRYVVLVFNVSLIISIFPLGEHYFVDAIASFIFVLIAYFIDQKIIKFCHI